MVEQLGNQSLNDQLKERKEKFVADGGLTDILKAEIKAILQTEIRKTLNQNLDSKDEMILLTSIPNNKGAPDTSNPESSKGKEIASMPKDDYQGGFLQSSPREASVAKSTMKIQELAYKIA